MEKLRSLGRIEDVTPEVARREFLAWMGASSLWALTGGNINVSFSTKTGGLSKPELAKNIFDLAKAAERKMGHEPFAYLEGGADDQLTVQANMEAYKEIEIRARRLVYVRNIDTSLNLFGKRLSTPILLAPVGLQAFFHPEGELASSKAAAKLDHQFVVSSVSNFSVGEIAKACGQEVWFQLYPTPDRRITRGLLERAEAAGCTGMFLTVDTPVLGNREKHSDTLNRLLEGGELALGNYEGLREDEPIDDPSMSWDMIQWLRDHTDMRIVLKGIVTREDAELAIQYGVDGVVVSNHGGRQLDMAMSAIETVPEIVAATKGQAEVYVDSGVRRGSDVIKALALGAKAVAIGRPLFWGLAVNGSDGVHGVLELLREEVDRCMAFCGQSDVNALEPGLINIPYGWGAGTTAP